MQLRGSLPLRSGPTVARGWNHYAHWHRLAYAGALGDEWNEPHVIGADVEADDTPRYVYERAMAPHLGSSAVVLEIGCGGGRFTEVARRHCGLLFAADTSKAMLRHARRRIGRDDHVKLVHLRDSRLMQFPDSSVDAAFSYDVFVHLHHWDIFNYLAALRRVVRPGGPLVIHHANLLSTLGWKRFLDDAAQLGGKQDEWWSFTAMTPVLFGELAARAGLTVVACDTTTARRDAITWLRRPAR